MRNIFTTRLLTVILLIAAVCLGLAAYTGAAGQDSPVSAAVGTVLSPLQKGVSVVTNKVGHLVDHFQNYDEMEAENKQLREKVAELEQQVRDAQVALDENENPTQVPGLLCDTEEEKEEFEAGKRRASLRKERRRKNY